MIYVITGRRGLGKTTLARYIAHKKTPRLVIDPRNQWPVTADDVVTEDANWPMLMWLEEGRTVIFRPRTLYGWGPMVGEVVEAFLKMPTDLPADLIDTWASPELSIVLDEAKLYEGEVPQLGYTMRCCDRSRVNIILTAHRPQDVSTDIRAILDYWCLFRTSQRHDLKAIADSTSPECADVVARLAPLHYVQWDDASSDSTIRVNRHPELWRAPGDQPLVTEPATLRAKGLFDA